MANILIPKQLTILFLLVPRHMNLENYVRKILIKFSHYFIVLDIGIIESIDESTGEPNYKVLFIEANSALIIEH